MNRPDSDFVLRPDDVLYRRVDDPNWVNGRRVAAAAFLDEGKTYPSQSFFVQRIVGTPRELLDRLSAQPYMKNLCPNGIASPEIICDHLGRSLCVVPAKLLIADLQLEVVKTKVGLDISPTGHVDIKGVRANALRISRDKRVEVLTRDEMLKA